VTSEPRGPSLQSVQLLKPGPSRRSAACATCEQPEHLSWGCRFLQGYFFLGSRLGSSTHRLAGRSTFPAILHGLTGVHKFAYFFSGVPSRLPSACWMAARTRSPLPPGLQLLFRVSSISADLTSSAAALANNEQSPQVFLSWDFPARVVPPFHQRSPSRPVPAPATLMNDRVSVPSFAQRQLPSVPDVAPGTPSVFVVSHHLDGLLRVEACRSVAPCSRSWGSPRFSHQPPARSTFRRTWIPDRRLAYSSRCLTLRSFPLIWQPSLRHRWAIPSCRCSSPASCPVPIAVAS
jgi:hypothetical protein